VRIYFSGISSADELEILKLAGTSCFLADIFDYARIAQLPGPKILDSGAWANFRQGKELPSIPDYISFAQESGCEWFLQQDIFGDPRATWENWLRMQHAPKCIPVYQWSGDRALLQAMIETAGERPIAIGGLVPQMRAHDEAMLAEVLALCAQYPNRFHILGIAWVKAMEVLRWVARSGDTAKFMVGGRRAAVVFVNTDTGRLMEAPYQVLPFAKEWDRRQRCVQSARTLEQYFNRGVTSGEKTATSSSDVPRGR